MLVPPLRHRPAMEPRPVLKRYPERMEPEPLFDKSIEFRPIGFTLSVSARPSTIRRTALRLLPWAL
jgi:hypothetical protein